MVYGGPHYHKLKVQNSAKFCKVLSPHIVRFTKYRKIFNLGGYNTAFYHLCNFCGSAHALTILTDCLSDTGERTNLTTACRGRFKKARLCSVLQSQCALSDTMRVHLYVHLLIIFNIILFSLCGKNSSKFHFIAVIFLCLFLGALHCWWGNCLCPPVPQPAEYGPHLYRSKLSIKFRGGWRREIT